MKKTLLVLLMFFALTSVALAQITTSESTSGALAISAPVITSSPTVKSQNDSGAVAVIQSYPNYIQPQPIYPYLLQMLPGVVGDATKEMPQFDIIQPLTTEKIVKVITFNGWCLDRIRLEDVEKEILEHLSVVIKRFGVSSTERIRFRVKYKMSSRSIGANLGGGGAAAGFGGGANPIAWGSNGSGLGAITTNTADPQFVISYYLIPLDKKERVLYEK
jgi:hypothetical protein